MASASEVSGRFDCVINGQGYVFDRTRESTLYGSRARAEYSYTPTFLERTNVTGAYGDDQQSFFMTVAQNDWSNGEGLKFYRANDLNLKSRYWQSVAVETTVPGQVTLQPKVISISAASNVRASCPQGFAISSNGHAFATSTNLYTVDSSGTITDQGAHGAGSPNYWGLCTDGVNIYIAGATKIRKWTGSAFSDFSATANAGCVSFI